MLDSFQKNNIVCRCSEIMILVRTILTFICLAFEGAYRAVAEEIEIRQVFVDKGTNVTIPCVDSDELALVGVQWVHQGGQTHHEVLNDGSLYLSVVEEEDGGLYECSLDDSPGEKINVTVRTPPPALVNVTVHASTILALILWNVAGDGGHPILYFTAQYRPAAPLNDSLEPWSPISPNHISPNSRQIDVYHLEPNEAYWFRVWASNALGPGPPVEVLATTLHSDQDAVLYKHFLADAKDFDPRTWLAAVCIVLGTLAVLTAGTTLVLCREWRRHDFDDIDGIELVPNIIMNPGFMESDPRPRDFPSQGVSIIKSKECPGPGKPRKV